MCILKRTWQQFAISNAKAKAKWRKYCAHNETTYGTVRWHPIRISCQLIEGCWICYNYKIQRHCTRSLTPVDEYSIALEKMRRILITIYTCCIKLLYQVKSYLSLMLSPASTSSPFLLIVNLLPALASQLLFESIFFLLILPLPPVALTYSNRNQHWNHRTYEDMVHSTVPASKERYLTIADTLRQFDFEKNSN